MIWWASGQKGENRIEPIGLFPLFPGRSLRILANGSLDGGSVEVDQKLSVAGDFKWPEPGSYFGSGPTHRLENCRLLWTVSRHSKRFQAFLYLNANIS